MTRSSMNGGARKPTADQSALARTGRIVGYARVSTDGQDFSAQISELKAAGCEKVLAEKQSGARSDRPQLRKALNALGKGDTLIVSRLDRLARSMRDLLNVLHEVAERGASFKSLHDPWADTTTAHGRLLLTVLGGLAEFERTLIAERTGEGRKRAMLAGVKFGRPRSLTPIQAAEAMRQRQEGKPLSMIAALFGCSARTIMRLGAAP